MSGRCVVAVDVGTSAVRAAVVEAGRGVSCATRVTRSNSVGGEVFDPNAMLDEVFSALRALDGASRAEAICISAHIGSVAVDSAMQPVIPGGSWADTRGADRLRQLAVTTQTEMLTAAGRPIATGGALALALNLRAGDESPRVFTLLSPKDFIVAHLTGVVATDLVDAAYTLAFDVSQGAWQTALLQGLDVPTGWFPRLIEPDSLVGAITPEAAIRTGVRAGTPVISGGPDGSVAIGLMLGTSTNGIADVAGTTDVVARLIARPQDAPVDAVINPAVATGWWTAGGATGLTGGAVSRWRSLVGNVDEDTLAEVPVGSRGLRIVPSMTGGRFPRWDSRSRGAVFGQTPEHGAPELLRAAQEGATFTVREGLDLLDPAPLGKREPLILAGGSTRSSQVAQLRANAFGRDVRVCRNPDVTILGAAALAMLGVGIVENIDVARDALLFETDTLKPDPDAAQHYDEVFTEWTSLRGL